MFKDWQRKRAVKKIKPGDGRALRPFHWWQWMSRGLLYLALRSPEGAAHTYAVDVSYWDYFLGEAKAHLFLDGKHHAVSKLPAAFPVPGGHIDVRMAAYGLKRCHFVAEEGSQQQLRPDPQSAEGHRARLDARHPVFSRWLGIGALVVLITALLLGIPQLVEMVTSWDVVAQYTGTWVSPVQLPDWLNGALIFGALAASIERALRLRYNWLLDGGDLDIDL